MAAIRSLDQSTMEITWDVSEYDPFLAQHIEKYGNRGRGNQMLRLHIAFHNLTLLREDFYCYRGPLIFPCARPIKWLIRHRVGDHDFRRQGYINQTFPILIE